VGEILGCDDDRIRFRVDAVRGQTLDVKVLTGGVLRPRKGINVLEHPLILRDLQESDVACIRATAGLGRMAFAFSFMTDGREAEWIRRRAPGCEVVGKIERREAAEKVLAISQASSRCGSAAETWGPSWAWRRWRVGSLRMNLARPVAPSTWPGR